MNNHQPPSATTKALRILVVRSGAASYLLRVLQELQASHPAAQISVWTDPDIVDELQRKMPHIHTILYSNLSTFFRTQLWQLRGKYDMAVVLFTAEYESRYSKFRILALLLGTKRFLTYGEDGSRTVGRLATVGFVGRDFSQRLRQTWHTHKPLGEILRERIVLLGRHLVTIIWFPIALTRLLVSVIWLVLKRYTTGARQHHSRPGSNHAAQAEGHDA